LIFDLRFEYKRSTHVASNSESRIQNPPSLHALIMAGGGGTRFWPRSRQRRPKQFLNMVGERSLLQQALERIEALVPPERTWVITSAAQRPLVVEQLPAVPDDQIVGEPCGRDTAACIGLGAALIEGRDPEAVMVAMPADHVIEPVQEFRRGIQAAAGLATEHPQALITFGIVPTFPATGYGYIQRGNALPGRQGVSAHRIQAFREKPAAETAEQYVQSGQFAWNSGIFVWRAATLLAELARQQPGLCAAVRRIADAWSSGRRQDVFRQEYEPLKRLSIDYAVMEGCTEGLVLQAPFQWDDVGSWQALERMNPQDADGNTILANHCGLHTKHCLIAGDAERLIATTGIDNILIVQDGDATLVADKRDEAGIKKLVELLKAKQFERYL
jgi:mannose-1-phosphate guanylyltransferase